MALSGASDEVATPAQTRWRSKRARRELRRRRQEARESVKLLQDKQARRLLGCTGSLCRLAVR